MSKFWLILWMKFTSPITLTFDYWPFRDALLPLQVWRLKSKDARTFRETETWNIILPFPWGAPKTGNCSLRSHWYQFLSKNISSRRLTRSVCTRGTRRSRFFGTSLISAQSWSGGHRSFSASSFVRWHAMSGTGEIIGAQRRAPAIPQCTAPHSAWRRPLCTSQGRGKQTRIRNQCRRSADRYADSVPISPTVKSAKL